MRRGKFLRAVLIGALVAAIGLFAWRAFRPSPDETVQPANGFNPGDFVKARPRLDAPYVVTDNDVVDAMLALAAGPAGREGRRSRLRRRPHPDRRRPQPRRARARRRHRSGPGPRGDRQCRRRRRRPPRHSSAARICSAPRSATPTCSPSISRRTSTSACASASSPRCGPARASSATISTWANGAPTSASRSAPRTSISGSCRRGSAAAGR